MDSQHKNEQHVLYTWSTPDESEETVLYQVRIEGGRFFQDQWIHLVKEHCPDNLPTEKLLPWEDLESWEQENVVKAYELIQHLAWTVGWPIDGLSKEPKGRFVHTCLIAQVWKRAPQREGIVLSDWNQLPAWQQEVYADLFDIISWYQEVADVPEYVSFFKKV